MVLRIMQKPQEVPEQEQEQEQEQAYEGVVAAAIVELSDDLRTQRIQMVMLESTNDS